jgi:hypothetical protein
MVERAHKIAPNDATILNEIATNWRFKGYRGCRSTL